MLVLLQLWHCGNINGNVIIIFKKGSISTVDGFILLLLWLTTLCHLEEVWVHAFTWVPVSERVFSSGEGGLRQTYLNLHCGTLRLMYLLLLFLDSWLDNTIINVHYQWCSIEWNHLRGRNMLTSLWRPDGRVQEHLNTHWLSRSPHTWAQESVRWGMPLPHQLVHVVHTICVCEICGAPSADDKIKTVGTFLTFSSLVHHIWCVVRD